MSLFKDPNRVNVEVTKLAQFDPADEEQAIKSLLPSFDDPRKVDYLVMRSVNFTQAEACAVLEIHNSEYTGWLEYDPEFSDWEKTRLRTLQRNVGAEVLRATFMRCVFLQLAIDTQTLKKRFFDPDKMNKEDREDARDALRRYNASSIQAMERTLDPGKEDGPGTGKDIHVDLKIHVTEGDAQAVVNKRAAARSLLDQFSRGEDPRANIVDGELA